MAGTRLVIQSVMVLQVVGVALFAAYAGLCGNVLLPRSISSSAADAEIDVLCVPLLQRGGISRLSSESDDPRLVLSLPPLSVAVSTSAEQRAWRGAWERHHAASKEESIDISVVSDEGRIKAMCQTSSDNEELTDYALVVCPKEAMDDKTQSMIGVSPRWGTTLVRPAADADGSMDRLIEAVYNSPSRSSSFTTSRRNVKLSLVLEEGMDWKSVTASFEDWLDQEAMSRWPLWCWNRPLDVSMSILPKDTTLAHTAKPLRRNDNTTSYLVSVRQLQRWIDGQRAMPTKHQTDDESIFQVFLYVPNRTELVIARKNKSGLEETTVASTDTHLFTLIDPSKEPPANSPFSQITYLLQRQCLGAEHPTWPISTWYIHLHVRRLVRYTYQRAREEASRSHQFLLRSSWTVPVTHETSTRWQAAVDLIQEATLSAQQGDYVIALDLLEESIAHSETIRSDPALMEPLEFPVDQYLAVFAPLLFPLLIPFLAGLIREVKRYRRLSTSVSKEKIA